MDDNEDIVMMDVDDGSSFLTFVVFLVLSVLLCPCSMLDIVLLMKCMRCLFLFSFGEYDGCYCQKV